MSIGAQNAFVMRQGLKKEHLLLTASLCSFIDAALISLGVLGFGTFLSSYPEVIYLTNYFAIVFLIAYGALCLRSFFMKNKVKPIEETTYSKQKIILLLLSFSLLNPHVYLDTVILLGSIAMQFPKEDKFLFLIGAIMASFAWFFTLTYGSRCLSLFLQKQNVRRAIDGATCLAMWMLAYTLI